MKYIKPAILILGFLLFGCNRVDIQTTLVAGGKVASSADDKQQIQSLIKQLLKWADSENSIDLLPVLTDSKDSIYIGFNLDRHNQNLDKLQKTDFFATEFVDNYNQIILTLDKGIRNGRYEQWFVGDLPTFIFANDINPWTMCQDIPYDRPIPWDVIEIDIIQLDNYRGEVNWRWGKLELNTNPSWKDFSYKCRIVKESDKWKIAFLQGFDFKRGIEKYGQIK